MLVALLLVACVAEAQERYPGQYTGVPVGDEWDKANWTTEQHIWYFVHQFGDVFFPALALAAAGAGGALWNKKRQQKT